MTLHKFTTGLLVLIVGWGLGWYTHRYWRTEPAQTVQPVIPAPANAATATISVAKPAPNSPTTAASIEDLLARDDFDAAVKRYEALRLQAGDRVAVDGRLQILAYVRQLLDMRQFSMARQLLELFLVSAHRDVEARMLLAAAYHGEGELRTAIDQLYEAKGYAYRTTMLQQIAKRTRAYVAELTQSLRQHANQQALLLLYQHLTQLEPDYAPYFLELATTQLALDDVEAARRSLQLIANDSTVGLQAQSLLKELSIALADPQTADSPAPLTEVVGIPLQRRGNHFIVAARPAHAQGIRLLIDTGASLTIVSPAVLQQRGIRYKDTGRTAVFTTANGQVQAPVYQLDALTVGDWQVGQLEIGVLDLNDAGVDGLLGMNFLRHFQFFIDQNEGVLRLSLN